MLYIYLLISFVIVLFLYNTLNLVEGMSNKDDNIKTPLETEIEKVDAEIPHIKSEMEKLMTEIENDEPKIRTSTFKNKLKEMQGVFDKLEKKFKTVKEDAEKNKETKEESKAAQVDKKKQTENVNNMIREQQPEEYDSSQGSSAEENLGIKVIE